ncbi:hypothetical protein E4U60_002941 [Claviceps pazoutovae]|uniref:Uncharacterized protein n=1 Tax=Claviceps pazoutovae TaxID=1649127 RepID=A0A9P7MIV7_9HYPO|nr:hypothetical protein E4U60_002941 [Claviceps pazoutovae]
MFKTPSPPSSSPSQAHLSPPTADTQAPFSPPTSHSHLGSLTSSSPRPQQPQQHQQSPPSPPPPPLPWLWTCHRCYHRYNIAITRRCLSCGHEFCLWQVRYLAHPNKNHTNKDMETQVQALIREGRLCALEFDYLGWRDWMAWRRRLYGWRAREQGTGTGTGAGSGGRERQGHDCTLDCDYPSQCLRERYLALRDLGLVEEDEEEEDEEEDEEGEEEEDEEDEEDMIVEEERRQTGRGPWNAGPST